MLRSKVPGQLGRSAICATLHRRVALTINGIDTLRELTDQDSFSTYNTKCTHHID
jgi:hypothetical protein